MGNILVGIKDWIVLLTLTSVVLCLWAFFDRITGPSWSVGESEWFTDFHTNYIQNTPFFWFFINFFVALIFTVLTAHVLFRYRDNGQWKIKTNVYELIGCRKHKYYHGKREYSIVRKLCVIFSYARSYINRHSTDERP